MTTEIIVPERFVACIKRACFDGDNECGAWALYSRSKIEKDPWTGASQQKLILHKLYPLSKAEIESSSPTHLTVRTAAFMRVLKRASEQGLVPGFLHGHPSGFDGFSGTDDENENALFEAAQNRIGSHAQLASLLCLPNGTLRARCWHSNTNVAPCMVTTTGSRFLRTGAAPVSGLKMVLDRQARVFGDHFNDVLQSLRVLVVGAGGTGSPLTIMLARAGVKFVASIDPDVIEDSNLHRLHGVGKDDLGKAKSHALSAHIRSLGLGTQIVGIQGNIIDWQHQDLLKAADIIFCATDDHAGRMILNRYAYFYETPVIDLGLAIAKGGNRAVREMTGRVTTLYPGTACLHCRNIIDLRLARDEELLRRDPDQFDQQRKEGYVVGGGDPEPAFIAMTTSVACMALEEFAQLLSGYRGHERSITQRLRRFQIPEDRISGGAPAPDCPLCSQSDDWGVGDITPFLDRVA